MAETIKELEMFPYFTAASYIHKSAAIRNDYEYDDFSREHPFASYFSTMVTCFAGKMIANALLAIPIVDPWEDSRLVVMATIMWYLMNYSPFDIFHKLSRITPVPLIIGIMVEINRCHSIFGGVNLGFDKYDSSPLIILSIGTICGSGTKFMLLIHRLIRGIWTPEDIEFMVPSCDTRASFVASLIFWYCHDDVTPCLYLMVLVFLLVMKGLRLYVCNPYSYVEKLLYQLTIGIWDTVTRALGRKKIEMPEIEIDIQELIPQPDPEPEPQPEPEPCPSTIPIPAIFKATKRRRSRSRKRSCSRRR